MSGQIVVETVKQQRVHLREGFRCFWRKQQEL